MATLSKLQPGQVVYELSRQRMGNTTVRTTRVIRVRIISVHEAHVIARWNGNPEKKFFGRAISKWRVSKPIMVEGGIGYVRLATAAEIAVAKEQGTLVEQPDRFRIQRT